MPNLDRVSEEMKKELNKIIAYELSDPRINAIISVTRVSVSKDLSYADASVSIFNAEDKKATFDALCGASSLIRKILFKRLKIRAVPEIRFHPDDGIEYSFHINEVLKQVVKSDEHSDEERED